MALVLAVILCLVCGFALASLGWPRSAGLGSAVLLRASLTGPFGLAVFSIIFFIGRVFGVSHLVALDLIAGTMLAAAAARRRSQGDPQGLKPALIAAPGGTAEAVPYPAVPFPVVPCSDRIGSAGSGTGKRISHPVWLERVVTAGFVVSVGAAVYSAWLRAWARPQGSGWDAFAIWNLHARFLFRGGGHWRDGFSPLISWSHPDYPLLLPAAVAHFWSYLGHDEPAVPAVIGLVFTFCTVGLLCAALWLLRGRSCALLGGLALLSTPAFIDLGTWQYADVPLSFFLLATVVFLCLRDERAGSSPGLLALAGVAAGFAAWTKNEGVLFLCAIVLALAWHMGRERSRKMSSQGFEGRRVSTIPLLAALTPVLVVIIYFKRFVAPPGDLFSDPASMLHKVLEPARYWAVIKWYATEFFRFGHWLAIPGTLLLVGFYFAVAKEQHARRGPGFRAAVVGLALTLAGYFAVYLITPLDIYWHLRFSLDRLFLQVWPAVIFLFFLSVRAGEQSAAGDRI